MGLNGIFFYIYCSPPLPVLLHESTGQGLQISGQLTRRDGQIFYSILFENNSQVPLDGFMIQFNKNTFGLAAAGPLQVARSFFYILFIYLFVLVFFPVL